jgi:two-component system chemotaxis response regulator CheB
MAEITRDIVVVGASAGGVQALQRLVADLPMDFPAAIFVVLHTWPESESYLASILSRAGPMPVQEAKDGEPIKSGKIHVARSDHHLLIEPDKMLVVRGPRENRFRPSINPLFRSAAASYRNRVIGVILTGMLDDGAAGLWAVKRCGGVAVVQSDAAFDQMPRAALDNVEVDHHVPLGEIPELLDRLTRERIPADGAPPVPDVVRVNDEGAKMQAIDFQIDGIGRRSLFSCPECNGALWEVLEGKQLQYRCHVGHAYTGAVLSLAQSSVLERSLWSALRSLKESAALDARLAERSQEHGLPAAATAHQANANQKLRHAEAIEEFLRHMRTEA